MSNRTEDRKRLTKRELEVAALLRRGLTNKEIGIALGIHEQTAKFHVCRVLGKLDVSNRTEAAARAEAMRIGEAAPMIPMTELGDHGELGWPWL